MTLEDTDSRDSAAGKGSCQDLDPCLEPARHHRPRYGVLCPPYGVGAELS